MNTPAISIIVPVYNMEQYLRECLDSIKAQTFTEWECILVDDGSSDSSPAICDEYAAADSRFKVIHQKNGGLSNARNTALRTATGEYIGFVDADDWIEPGMYDLLYKMVKDEDADIAQVGYRTEYHGRHSTKHLTGKAKVIDGKTAMKEIGFDRLPNYVWNKLHRRSIITCDFPDGRNFEDIFVYGQWLKNVKKMVLDPTPMYHYRMRKGSIIHTDAAKNRYDYFLSCIDRMHMIESTLNGEKDSNRRNAYINKSAVNACKSIARMEKDSIRRKEGISRIREKLMSFPLPPIQYMNPKTWWRVRLLREKPKLFSILMRGVYVFDLDSRHRAKQLFD